MSDRAWWEDTEYIAYCHEADMDGLGCALLLYSFTNVWEINFVDYPLPADLGADGKVVICDLNPGPNSPAWQNPNLVVFDHHGEPPADANVRFADARDGGDDCATRMLWRHLVPQMRIWIPPGTIRLWSQFVDIVNAGDLYLEDHPWFDRSRQYTWLLNTFGIRDLLAQVQHAPQEFLELPARTLQLIEMARRRENRRAYAAAMASLQEGNLDGDPFAVVLLPGGDRSSVLSSIANNVGCPVIGVNLDGMTTDEPATCSVRDPRGGARALAEQFGGGGHREAAGFTLPAQDALRLWAEAGEDWRASMPYPASDEQH